MCCNTISFPPSVWAVILVNGCLFAIANFLHRFYRILEKHNESLSSSSAPILNIALLLRLDRASTLHHAASCGGTNRVRQCLDKIASPRRITALVTRHNKYGLSPLHCACIMGHLDVVRYLVGELNADILYKTTKETGNETALHLACRQGHLPIVQYLSEVLFSSSDPSRQFYTKHQNPIDSLNSKDQTPFLVACHAANFEVAQYLIEKVKANVHAKDSNGMTAISLVVSEAETTFAPLLDGASIAARTSRLHGTSATRFLRYLLQDCQVNDLETTPVNGWTALHHACANPLTWESAIVSREGLLSTSRPDQAAAVKDSMDRTPLHVLINTFQQVRSKLIVVLERSSSTATTTRVPSSRESALLRNLETSVEACVRSFVSANPLLHVKCVEQLLDFCSSSLSDQGPNLFLDWIGQYSQYSLGIDKEVTRKYPLHSILQCPPLMKQPNLDWTYLLRVEEACTSRSEQNHEQLLLKLIHGPEETRPKTTVPEYHEHHGPLSYHAIQKHYSVATRTLNDQGMLPLQVYLQSMKVSLDTCSSDRTKFLEIVQALLRANPTGFHRRLARNDNELTDSSMANTIVQVMGLYSTMTNKQQHLQQRQAPPAYPKKSNESSCTSILHKDDHYHRTRIAPTMKMMDPNERDSVILLDVIYRMVRVNPADCCRNLYREW